MAALAPLILVALVFFSFAFVYVCRKWIQALFNPIIAALGPIPGVGNAIRSALGAVENAISRALGAVEAGLDAVIGASWHLLAGYADWQWDVIRRASVAIYNSADLINQLINAVRHLGSRIDPLQRISKGINDAVKRLQREWRGIEHRVKAIERTLARGIGHDLRITVRAIQQALNSVRSKVIPNLRTRVATVENDVTALRKWVATEIGSIGTDVSAAAVAVALAALGLGGLRCSNFAGRNGLLGRRGCGLWSGLDNLLGMFADLFFITNLCELIGPLETAFSTVAAPAIGALTAAIDEMPCVAGHQPPTMNVPQLYLTASPGDNPNL